jgi:hypothetical protein
VLASGGLRWVALLCPAIALLLLACPGEGRADTQVLPAKLGSPWSDPVDQSPLEQLLAPIASHIAGRSVAVDCDGTTEWSALTAQQNIDPDGESGYVDGFTYLGSTKRFVSNATTMHLSPTTCALLQTFAQASIKPTKCQASTTATVSVMRQRLVTRYRAAKVIETAAPCFLGTPPTSRGWCWTVPTVSGSPEQSCYETTANEPAGFWSDYYGYAWALDTLAHEAIHLWQDQVGARVPANALVESQAACYSMQWLPYVATQLGDTPDDAQAIADFYWDIAYPSYLSLRSEYAVSRPYWSADCAPGGALDIRGDKTGIWP